MSGGPAADRWRSSPDAPGSLGPPAKVAPPGAVDVVVPVFGAAAELAHCLGSVERHTDLARHRLVVVVDGDPTFDASAVEAMAARWREHGAGGDHGVTVLRQPERRGFVASVNRGMAGSRRDVVLLNSDTVVTRGWIEKLQAAALSAPEVATVTPFSNHATICSLPRFLEVNALPAGWDLDRFAALVERVSIRERPRLPTGVGVCLYVRRDALDRLGPFDQRTFGLGYGEESEFCARAAKAGWIHLLDDSTFIWHVGASSFGASREARVRAAHRAMRRLHPEYLPAVARFIADDPLAPARERVLEALRSRPLATSGRPGTTASAARRVVHVVHGWPPWNHAGTETYARGLVLRQAAWREVAVYTRRQSPRDASPRAWRRRGEPLELFDGGARVRLVANDFTQRDPLSRNALRDSALVRDFASFLAQARPDLVHVHHLAGHAFGLLDEVARRGIPLVYQVQDWWTVCARVNLLDSQRHSCSGPAPAKCAACLPLTRLRPAPLWNRVLHRYRSRAARRAFRHAWAWIFGSQAIEASYRDLGLLCAGDLARVLPYGVDRAPRAPRLQRAPGAPLRCGVIGSLLPHKGIHVAAAAFAGIDPARARLSVWGDPAVDAAYASEVAEAAPGRVELRGRFPEGEKPAIFASLDLLIVPSLGLESFGLVAREALHHGVPVLASRRGALAELFGGESEGAGALCEPQPAELRRWIERLVAEPALLERWRARVPAVKGMDEHAEEIECVYSEVIATRGRRRALASGAG